MSVRLVLSGQSTHLKDSGGVGRYAAELYRRVVSQSIREYVPEGDVVAWDFPNFEEKPRPASPSGSGIPRKLKNAVRPWIPPCLLYTSDAADERSSVDLGGRRIIKKKK